MIASAHPAVAELARQFLTLDPAGAARALQDVEAEGTARLLAALDPTAAAEVLERLGPEIGSGVVAALDPGSARSLLVALGPTAAAQLLNRLDPDTRDALLTGLPPVKVTELRSFMSYPEGSAGQMMDPRAVVYRADARAGDVSTRLRTSRRPGDEVILIVDTDQRLVGTIPIVDVVLATPETRLSDLPLRPSPAIHAFDSRDDVVERLDRHNLMVLPVVDLDGRPLGVIHQSGLVRMAEQDATADMQSMVGASREERALSKVSFAVRKRLPWLQINLLTAFLAAAVVGLFESTIAQFTALAVLLPVVAGQSGNTGAQALAVTMRGLALREIGLRHWLRVSTKEAAVGLFNGLAVAAVTMVGVYFWSGSLGLCAVIGVSMVISMAIAGVAGAAVPLVLHAIGQDPAQSSSIVLTTVTDIAGFFSFLGLATVLAGIL